jgi:SAM-dependent MidA family methyltransferase
VRSALAAAGGWLPFDEYLKLVMYGPGLGYYSAGSVKFGAAGDFVTAPELSSLFGFCVARQIASVLQALGGSGAVGGGGAPGVEGAATTVLEFGAGSGRLAFDVLTRLDTLGQLPAQYLILEISADLRARQQALLAMLRDDLAARVQWIDALPATPIRGVVLANEVLDALPFKRFVLRESGCEELGVALDANGDCCWRTHAPTPPLHAALADLPKALRAAGAADGFESEICPLIDGWIASLAASLAAGAILLFDYGVGRRDYYHAERSRGTLRCHYRHRAHDDPLLLPGIQDITAWVDFTRVAEAADAAGLEVTGFCSQAAFLMGAGIDQELQAAAPGGALSGGVAGARLAAEARQLLLPGEMGENFKALALTRGLELPLAAFALQDLRHHL